MNVNTHASYSIEEGPETSFIYIYIYIEIREREEEKKKERERERGRRRGRRRLEVVYYVVILRPFQSGVFVVVFLVLVSSHS